MSSIRVFVYELDAGVCVRPRVQMRACVVPRRKQLEDDAASLLGCNHRGSILQDCSRLWVAHRLLRLRPNFRLRRFALCTTRARGALAR